MVPGHELLKVVKQSEAFLGHENFVEVTNELCVQLLRSLDIIVAVPPRIPRAGTESCEISTIFTEGSHCCAWKSWARL